MRWCWWRCWWRWWFPRWWECWWWRRLRFPPLGGKFPRQNRSTGEQKCSCPGSASSPETLLPFFSRANRNLWPKDVGRGATRAPHGLMAVARGWPRHLPMWLAGGAPLVYFCSTILHIFQNNSPKIHASVWVSENCYLCCCFSRSEFQLPVISLLWCILHFKREKALELHYIVKYIIEIR